MDNPTSIFPTVEETTPNIFPESSAEKQIKERKEFIVSLAERYADNTGMPVSQAVDKAEFEGTASITPSAVIGVTERDVFEEAYRSLKTPEQMKQSLENYVKNKQIFAVAKEDIDVAEKVVADPLSISNTRLLKMAKLRTAVQKIMPERSIFGTTVDFLGYLGREATYGSLENVAYVLGIGGKTAREQGWYKRLLDSPIEETDAVAAEIANEMASFGLIGDNTFYLSQLSEGTLAQGLTENEALWAAVDIAALGAGKVAKLAKATDAAVDATRVATAVDPADMKIATSGVAAGDNVVKRAIVDGVETSVELPRQTAPGISRVATVNAENAITPTMKPVYDVEASNKINAVLQKTLNIYKTQVATPDELVKSVEKYAEDLTRTTSYGILNVTRDIPIVATGKAAKTVKVTGKTAGELLPGVRKSVYKKALDVVKTAEKAGKDFSLTDFMKVSGLEKKDTFLYVKQLRQDGIISSSNKILSTASIKPKVTTTSVAAEPVSDVTAALKVEDIGGLNSYDLTVYMGRKDGTPFKTKVSGEKAAAQLGGTLVKLVDGYVVKRSRTLPIEFSLKTSLTKEQQELRSLPLDFLMSPEVTSNLATEAIMKSGISKLNAVGRQIGRELGKSLSGLSRKEKDGLLNVVNELTNDYARRNWYNEAEFNNIYYRYTNTLPSEKVYKAYKLRADLYETAYILRADDALKTAINNNEFIGRFKNSIDKKIKKVSVADSEDVFDFDTGKLVKAGDIKGKAIYEIRDEVGLDLGDYKQFYVTGTLENNRGLAHADVLGYKPGANRALPNASHVVVQDNIVETISGAKRTLTPKTVLVERTEGITNKAVTEINTILKAVRDVYRGNVEAVRAAPGLDDIIRANNSFNPNIEDVDDFIKFMDEAGLSYSDVRVERMDTTFDGKRTFRDLYDLNTNPVGRRPDLILHGYGTKGIHMRNPLEAIEREYTRGVNIAATTRYFDTTIPDFMKKGEKYIDNFNSIKNLPNIQKIREAVINTGTIEGRAFAREQAVILSRLNEQSNFAKSWERFIIWNNEQIFKAFGEESIGLGKVKFSTLDYLSSDPTTAIRGFAFQLRMGLFAMDQLYVQGLNILPMLVLHPVEGFKAAAAYMPIRMAMKNRNPTVIKEVAKRSAKLLDMTEDEFIEMTDHFYNSGRFDIGDTISEVGGTGVDFGAGYFKKVKEAGMVFFKEGERIPRSFSHFIAYKEFKKKYPNIDTKTADGARVLDEFLINYSEALTFNMSSVSNAGWQKGFTGLMTQWLSYNARFMETIFFSRTLTKAQRSKLALSQLFFFGVQGAGLGYALDYGLEKAGISLDVSMHTGVKQGMLDYLLTEITGEPTNISSRLGIGQGLVDYLYKWVEGEETALSLLGGPGTSISLDFLTQGFNLMKTLVTGDVTLSKIALERMFREIKSVDKTIQTIYALNTRDIITKNGFEQFRNASDAEIFLNALSVPLQESQIGFTISDALNKQREYTKEMANKAKDLYRRMNDAYEAGDVETAKDLANTINAIRLGITYTERENFEFMLKPSMGSFAETMIMKAWKSGLDYQATQGRKVIEE
jgi:hypothetical protein